MDFLKYNLPCKPTCKKKYRRDICCCAWKLCGSLPHTISVIPKHGTNDMQKIFLIQTTEKKYAFWCHAITSGTNLRRLPQGCYGLTSFE